LFLPAYIANMAPVVATKVNIFPRLNVPIDGSNKDTMRPLFGVNKTYRGFVTGILAGVGVAFLQLLVRRNGAGRLFTEFPYTYENFLLWGLVLGAGALIGDLVKSYFKRRLNIPSGHRWLPWDQLDMVLGGLLFGSLMYRFSWQQVVVLLVVSPLLILIVNLVSYWLKIKKEW
jgi:CDP-2,3-bis-(O-geranylgeranyl)-sn-glycerol synthase